MLNIQTLNNSLGSGVFALVNEQDKKVYVAYSSCFLVSIARLLHDIKDNSGSIAIDTLQALKKDIHLLQYVSLEITTLDRHEQMLRQVYWLERYKTLGYSSYRKEYVGVQYKVKVELHDNGLLHVYLVSKRYKKLLVGTFSSVTECDQFVEKHYPEGKPIDRVVYLTIEKI